MKRRSIAAGVLAGMLGIAASAHAQAPPRILVMPFENVARDSRIFWLTEAAAVLLADNLNAQGANAISREERRAAFERLRVPPAAVLTDATVIRLGQLVGASQVVVGTLQLQGETLLIRAKSIALEPGRIQSSAAEGGPLTELFAVFERLGSELAPPGSVASSSAPSDHPPVRAFENYIKGLLAETPATAVNYLNAALKAYPSFDRPRLALWEVYTDQGDHERALAAVRTVPVSARFGPRAAFLASLSQLSLKRFDEAFRILSTLVEQWPTAVVYNNLGVVQLRRGASAAAGSATSYFNRAAEIGSQDSDYFFNLGYAYWLQRDAQSAIYWLREAVRRDPTDGDAHLVLAAALSSAGQTVEASRERELAKRLSSKYEDIDRRPPGDQVPAGLERVKSGVELPSTSNAADALTASGQREQRELARFHLEAAQHMFAEERDRDALQELNRALFLSPYEAAAHLLVGRIHLRNGRVAEAIDALKISLWSQETADAHAVLAEAYLAARDAGAARAEAERALTLDAGHSAARRVLDQIK
jgi:tetratricopeptide (TPR) repeat protein